MKTATLAGLALMLVCGCQALNPVSSEHPTVYTLTGGAPNAAPQAHAKPPAAAAGPTLIVSTPHAAAGFDSPHMMYLRQADKIEYFAHNQWIDTPARMLGPLIVTAVERTGAFRAVVQTPSPAGGELRLDTEVRRLQHEFLGTPSRVRFTLRAYLVDNATRRVIATREFEATVPAGSENPQGGVTAANQAVQTVLENLSAFCAEAVRSSRRGG